MHSSNNEHRRTVGSSSEEYLALIPVRRVRSKGQKGITNLQVEDGVLDGSINKTNEARW